MTNNEPLMKLIMWVVIAGTLIGLLHSCVSAVSPSSVASFQCSTSDADSVWVNGLWGRLEYDCED